MSVFPHPRVLIIDDDADLRALLSDWLRHEGFWVEEAADGMDALSRIASSKFDLLLTDLRLPGQLSGLETVRSARGVDPELRALFISGSEEPKWDNRDIDDFVYKPFRSRELIGCVWELICRKPPADRTGLHAEKHKVPEPSQSRRFDGDEE